jgi:transposase-like protein
VEHHSKEKIVDTIELYVGGGVSTRYTAQYLEISKNTVLRWVFKYVGTISRFTKRLIPRIIQKINLDELFLKMCSQFFYLLDAICADSRFVFFFFAPTRKNKDDEELIKQFRNAMLMVFDGAFQYPSVLKKIFRIWRYYHNTHRCKDFKDKNNNNIVEMPQNFFRSKTYQRRGFRSLRTGIMQIQMLFIYYNFVRIHSSIKMTPAEKQG